MEEQFSVRTLLLEKDGKPCLHVYHPDGEITVCFNDKKPEYVLSILEELPRLIQSAAEAYFVEVRFKKEVDGQLEKWLDDSDN